MEERVLVAPVRVTEMTSGLSMFWLPPSELYAEGPGLPWNVVAHSVRVQELMGVVGR